LVSKKARLGPCLFLWAPGKIRGRLLLLFLVLAGGGAAAGENPDPGYPRIERLEPGDLIFRQYAADVEAARRRLSGPGRSPGGAARAEAAAAELLTIYAYQARAGDDLFSLAARCNIPYAALATLNHLSRPGSLEGAGTLLLPSTPGLFIPEEPGSDLERLLLSGRREEPGLTLHLAGTGDGAKERVRFIPGADFSPTERIFFLNPGVFSFPLREYRLTSVFGPRRNPVTGNLRFHQGLDFAAPLGSGVYAARDGVVSEIGEDPIYGVYIIIQHGENWKSLYGHLSAVHTALRSSVRSGTLIGSVGSTGQSTGPHLHFELRQNDTAQDPGKYLFKEGGR
jgi:murein DD-endopeptidase MepM/ murein hydrolase activator NlpD